MQYVEGRVNIGNGNRNLNKNHHPHWTIAAVGMPMSLLFASDYSLNLSIIPIKSTKEKFDDGGHALEIVSTRKVQ